MDPILDPTLLEVRVHGVAEQANSGNHEHEQQDRQTLVRQTVLAEEPKYGFQCDTSTGNDDRTERRGPTG